MSRSRMLRVFVVGAMAMVVIACRTEPYRVVRSTCNQPPEVAQQLFKGARAPTWFSGNKGRRLLDVGLGGTLTVEMLRTINDGWAPPATPGGSWHRPVLVKARIAGTRLIVTLSVHPREPDEIALWGCRGSPGEWQMELEGAAPTGEPRFPDP